jgi:hypothetical protein
MRRARFESMAPAISLALLLAAGTGPRARCLAAADDPPDLTGRWTLNTDQSEDARKKIADARESDRRAKGPIGGLGPIGPGPRGGGPMGGGPMGGRPTGTPTGGRSRGPDEDTRTSPFIAELMSPPKTLVIGTDGGEVTFDTGEETLLRLRPGGRKVKREAGSVEMKARWKDGELVVDAEHEDGDRMTTSYRVGSDRQSLYVTTKVQPVEGDDLEVRHVYDAAAPAK